MSLSIEQFDEFFHALWDVDPFPWQTRLAEQVFKQGWPDCIDLPTASGKTAAIDIAVFTLACQADRETNKRTVGRRIFFTVNRRVIVDEAFERAKKLAERLLKPDAKILKQVTKALHEIGGDDSAPPLDIAQLRGGIYRDRAWARSITQPIVVCTTADQLGSRLLFRGYGVSASSAPIHAALCGCDSLVLLDEAHVTRAFCQTMQLLTRYQKQHNTAPPMRFVQMTATPAGNVKKRFGLNGDDRSHPILKTRQKASKPATLVKLEKKKPISGEIVSRAFDAISESRKAIGIIVNRVQTAREIERLIQEEIDKRSKKDDAFKAEVHLVIGRMRPIDRDELQNSLRTIVGPDRPEVLDNPVFVVATQCLEVGADYDFDALITECASIDALRQRFGRLNRKGRPVEVLAAIVTNEESLKGGDAIYEDAIKHTWDWLSESDNDSIHFGIAEFKKLWDGLDDARCQTLLAPAPDAAVLLPAHLDALCQTNPQPVPSPDVSYFIHGPKRDNAEVNVCWRADLGDNPDLWNDIVRLLPPTSPECMTVPLHVVIDWMKGTPTTNDADIPVRLEDEDSKKVAENWVLVWRGSGDAAATSNPHDIRPGDTVVVPAHAEDSLSLGHIPRRADGFGSLDVAEVAYERARRQRIVRIHPLIHPELPKELRDYAVSDEILISKARIRELLGPLASNFTSGPDEIQYPRVDENTPVGLLLRFNKLLPDYDALRPSIADDDGDTSSVESTFQVLLEAHTQHVVDCVKQSTKWTHTSDYALLFQHSAELHDIGKADVRFQAVLAGLTPYEVLDRPALLAKSGKRGLTRMERERRRVRGKLPDDFRHEMLSAELVENLQLAKHVEHRDLLLHLIASHHGHARPFAPVVIDNAKDETRSVAVDGLIVTPEQRTNWIPSHRLDSGVAERFWKLTRQHGWWGLAWLESILRLADQQASAAEQEQSSNKETRDE